MPFYFNLKEILFFQLKKCPESCMPKLLVPPGSNVYPGNLRTSQNLPQTPHKCTVHSHQLLSIHPICFVENDPNLIVPARERLYSPPELVTDIKLVSIKQQQDNINPGCKPLQNLNKVIAPEDSRVVTVSSVLILPVIVLLLSRQDTRGVNQGDLRQQLVLLTCALESVEKTVPKPDKSCNGGTIFNIFCKEYLASGLNGSLGSTTRALPGMQLGGSSASPSDPMITWNLTHRI